jgi:DNA-binding transcriptional LysR family regulator
VDGEPAALKFVSDSLGVALMPEQITGLPHEGVVFRPLSPPLRRESTIAWRADNLSKPVKDYIQIVKDLSRSAAATRRRKGTEGISIREPAVARVFQRETLEVGA